MNMHKHFPVGLESGDLTIYPSTDVVSVSHWVDISGY